MISTQKKSTSQSLIAGARVAEIARWLWEKGFFHLLSVNFASQFLGLFVWIVLPWLLRPQQVGEVRILQAYISVVLVFATFGYGTSVLKYCAVTSGATYPLGVLKTALSCTSMIASGITLVAIGLAFSGSITSSPRLRLWLAILLFSVPFTAISNVFLSYIQARKRIKELGKWRLLLRVLTSASVLGLVAVWGFAGFVFATVGAALLGLGILAPQFQREWKAHVKAVVPDKFHQIAAFSMLADLAFIAAQYGDIFLLDHLISDRSSLGAYALATSFVGAVSGVPLTAQSIIVPYLSSRSDDPVFIREQHDLNLRRMLLLSLILGLATFVLVYFLQIFVYGPAYAAAPLYVAVLLFKFLAGSFCAVTGAVLWATGLVKYNFLAAVVSLIVSLVAGFFLIKAQGVIGAAWSQVLQASCMLSLSLYFCRKHCLRSFKTMSNCDPTNLPRMK